MRGSYQGVRSGYHPRSMSNHPEPRAMRSLPKFLGISLTNLLQLRDITVTNADQSRPTMATISLNANYRVTSALRNGVHGYEERIPMSACGCCRPLSVGPGARSIRTS